MLCYEFSAQFDAPLDSTEFGWLSSGKLLNEIFELRERNVFFVWKPENIEWKNFQLKLKDNTLFEMLADFSVKLTFWISHYKVISTQIQVDDFEFHITVNFSW